MLRLWNRLVSMDNNRLTKKIFLYDLYINRNNSWCSEIRTIFDKIGLFDNFQNRNICDINSCEQLLFENHCIEWTDKTKEISKLRTYILIKNQYNTEDYVKAHLPKQERSFFSSVKVWGIAAEGRNRAI